MGCIKDGYSERTETELEGLIDAAYRAHPEWSFSECLYWAEQERRRIRGKRDERRAQYAAMPKLFLGIERE